MKKFISIAVAALIALTLIAGCSGGGNQNAANTQLQGGQQSQGQQGAQQSQGQQGGQQSQGQQGGKMVEPQQLISRMEAAQLVGEEVKDAIKEEQSMFGLKICLYVAEKPDSKSYLQVALIQQGSLQGGGQGGSGGQGDSGGQGGSEGQGGGQASGGQSGGQGGAEGQMSPKSIFQALKRAIADPNTDAGRIGEEAFISAPGISILSGEYYIYVAASGPDPAAAQQITKQAGELAVNNLKRMLGQ